ARAITTLATRFISAAKRRKATKRSSKIGQTRTTTINKRSGAIRKIKTPRTITSTSKRRSKSKKTKKRNNNRPPIHHLISKKAKRPRSGKERATKETATTWREPFSVALARRGKAAGQSAFTIAWRTPG